MKSKGKGMQITSRLLFQQRTRWDRKCKISTRPSGENLIACIRISLNASIPMKINMKWKESKQERKVMLIEVDIQVEKYKMERK